MLTRPHIREQAEVTELRGEIKQQAANRAGRILFFFALAVLLLLCVLPLPFVWG